MRVEIMNMLLYCEYNNRNYARNGNKFPLNGVYGV